jgi:cytosine/uracil/thiamine/allantoin permease
MEFIAVLGIMLVILWRRMSEKMEGSFMIMAGIAVCLLIAVILFWLVLIGFGIHWIVEHKKEIKEQQREV